MTSAASPDKRGLARRAGGLRRVAPHDPRAEVPANRLARDGVAGTGGDDRPAGRRVFRAARAATPVLAEETATTGLPAPMILPAIRETSPVVVDPSGSITRPLARKVASPPTAPSEPDTSVAAPDGLAPDAGEPQLETTGLMAIVAAVAPPEVARGGRPSITFQRRSTRPRVRRVTRVVRHVDTWSVFKVALVFNVFLYAVALTAGVLLWHVAIATGTVDNVEKFFEGFGWKTFRFKGGEIYHNAWVAGMFVTIGLTGLAVLMATLFNLITDLVGGVRVSVLEEEVLARRDRIARVAVDEPTETGLPYDQARSG